MIATMIEFVINAYQSGLMQYDELSVCGIQVTMEMKSRMNILTIKYCGKISKINIYDSDSAELQNRSIENLLLELTSAV